MLATLLQRAKGIHREDGWHLRTNTSELLVKSDKLLVHLVIFYLVSERPKYRSRLGMLQKEEGGSIACEPSTKGCLRLTPQVLPASRRFVTPSSKARELLKRRSYASRKCHFYPQRMAVV